MFLGCGFNKTSSSFNKTTSSFNKTSSSFIKTSSRWVTGLLGVSSKKTSGGRAAEALQQYKTAEEEAGSLQQAKAFAELEFNTLYPIGPDGKRNIPGVGREVHIPTAGGIVEVFGSKITGEAGKMWTKDGGPRRWNNEHFYLSVRRDKYSFQLEYYFELTPLGKKIMNRVSKSTEELLVKQQERDFKKLENITPHDIRRQKAITDFAKEIGVEDYHIYG